MIFLRETLPKSSMLYDRLPKEVLLFELHIAFVVTPTTGSHLHQSHILISQRNYETTNVSTDLATKVTSSGFPGMRSLLPIAKEFVTTYRFNVHARSIHIPCEIMSLNYDSLLTMWSPSGPRSSPS